ncbi:MAG: hypothetical protein LIO62_05160 [Clostridiales bacterium]|nr:hypothetical protein [Clostridiales bacterium]
MFLALLSVSSLLLGGFVCDRSQCEKKEAIRIGSGQRIEFAFANEEFFGHRNWLYHCTAPTPKMLNSDHFFDICQRVEICNSPFSTR